MGNQRFRINKDETMKAGLARVTQALLASMLDALQSYPQNSEAIHQTRVAGKRLRAVAKLLKKSLPKFAKQLNAEIRDIARLLSVQRDAEVKLEVIQQLLKDADEHEKLLLQQLTEYYQAGAIDQPIIEKNVDLAKEKVAALGEVISGWNFKNINDTKIIKALNNEFVLVGLGYKENRKEPDPVDMHTWRKHTKTCLYQCQILETHLKEKYTKHIDRLKKLGILLGHYHDLELVLEDIEEPVIGDWGDEECAKSKAPIEKIQITLLKKIFKHGREISGKSS